MKNIFKKSDRLDMKIYDLKQVESYLDKIENIKRDYQASNMSLNYFMIK